MNASCELRIVQEIAARLEQVTLTSTEMSRYSRHLLLPEVGLLGQRKLKAARVLVLGVGGLGSPVALYLAAAGVGTLGLIDFDLVELSNMQRQILYTENDCGRSKVAAAGEWLKAQNPTLHVVQHQEKFSHENSAKLLAAYDLIVDGSDNFATRYLANDAAVAAGKPYIYGSIFRFEGQTSVFYPPYGPCYRCLFPKAPAPTQVPNCAEAGVLGVLPGQIGVIQATEALKLILGLGEPLIGRLLMTDSLGMRTSEVRVPKDPSCAVCGAGVKVGSNELLVEPCLLGSQATHEMKDAGAQGEVSVEDLHRMRSNAEPHLLLDVRSDRELEICRIEGALHIPVSALSSNLVDLKRDVPLIVYCKSGARSAAAVDLLRARGFSAAKSLSGGILAWIAKISPDLQRY